MTTRTRNLPLACAAALAVAATAFAQYALDNNLQRGSGGMNPGRQLRSVVTADSYTLNRDTGTMEFNDANAFAMPSYSFSRMPSSYTQYHRDTVRPTTARDGVYVVDRRTGSFRYNSTNAFGSSIYNPRGSAAAPPPMPTRVYSPPRPSPVPMPAPRTGGSGGSGRAPSLAMPTYRVP